MKQGGEKELHPELVKSRVKREQFFLKLYELIYIKPHSTKPAMQDVLGDILVMLWLRWTPSGPGRSHYDVAKVSPHSRVGLEFSSHGILHQSHLLLRIDLIKLCTLTCKQWLMA